MSAAIEDIDTQISDCENTIRTLKSRRNVLVPISTLPIEVLCEIFVVASRDTARTTGLRLSQVCVLWRSAALACPPMWADLVFARISPDWTKEMLRRTKDAPITVRADMAYRTPQMLAAVGDALKHINRITELSLAEPWPSLKKLLPALCQPAPVLHTIDLTSSRGTSLDGEPPDLPKDLFAGSAPSLRRLTVSYCRMDWMSQCLQNLTQLSVKGATSYASLCDILAVLAKMPMLEDLSLCHILANASETTVDSTPVIKLSRLSHLTLESNNIPAVTKLLQQICIPPSCTVKITIIGSTSPAVLLPFMAALNECGEHSTRLLSRPFKTVYVGSDFGPFLVFKAYDIVRPKNEEVLELKLDYSAHNNSCLTSFAQTITSVVPVFDTQKLVLSLQLGLPFTSERERDVAVAKLFLACRRIRQLTLRDGEPDALLTLLGKVPKIPEGKKRKKNPSVLVLPQLRKLSLLGAEFVNGQSVLAKMLRRRMGYKAKLHTLEIMDAISLYADDVHELVELVEALEWDEEEQAPEEEDDEDDSDEDDSMYGYDMYY